MYKIKSCTSRYMLVIIVASFMLSACGEAYTDTEYLARAKDYQDKGELQASVI